MDDEKKAVLAHSAAQVDEGINKAYAAAPQESTYTKEQVENLIPTVEALSTDEINQILSL